MGEGVGSTPRTIRGYFLALWRVFTPDMDNYTTEGYKRLKRPKKRLKIDFVFLYKNSASVSVCQPVSSVTNVNWQYDKLSKLLKSV